MQRPGQHPRKGYVEQEARELDNEELDLQTMVLGRAVAAEAPAAVEHEADADRAEEGDDDGENGRHHVGREVPVDRRIERGEREADDGEAHQLSESPVRKV